LLFFFFFWNIHFSYWNTASSSASSLELSGIIDSTRCSRATIRKYYQNNGYFLCIDVNKPVKTDTNCKEYPMLDKKHHLP